MADQDLSYWDYVKAAFNLKPALPLLGGMPVNKLALAGFVILGFGNPGFWLLGVGLEAGYLLMLSSSPRFQNLIKGGRLAKAQQAWREREQEILDRLDRPSRQRYDALAERCRAILKSEDLSGAGDTVMGLHAEGLNQLLLIFLRLLSMRCRIEEMLDNTSRKDIESDIRNLEEKIKLEPADSPVRRALQGTLEIQQTRLDNLNKSYENLKFTETELDRIDKQISLIAEGFAVSKNPEQWSVTLDGVVKSMHNTSQWMADNSAFFTTIDAPAPQVNLLNQPPPIKPPPLPPQRNRG